MSVTVNVSGGEYRKVLVEVLDSCSCTHGNCMSHACILGYEAQGVEFYCLKYPTRIQNDLNIAFCSEDDNVRREAFKKFFSKPCPECDTCEGTGHASIYEYEQFEPDGSTLPTMNMANGTFRSLAQALGLESENLCGSLEGKELDIVIKNAIRLLNHVDSMVTETTCEQNAYRSGNSIKRTPLMIQCGHDEEYWKERITLFLNICKVAKAKGRYVTWG